MKVLKGSTASQGTAVQGTSTNTNFISASTSIFTLEDLTSYSEATKNAYKINSSRAINTAPREKYRCLTCGSRLIPAVCIYRKDTDKKMSASADWFFHNEPMYNIVWKCIKCATYINIGEVSDNSYDKSLPFETKDTKYILVNTCKENTCKENTYKEITGNTLYAMRCLPILIESGNQCLRTMDSLELRARSSFPYAPIEVYKTIQFCYNDTIITLGNIVYKSNCPVPRISRVSHTVFEVYSDALQICNNIIYTTEKDREDKGENINDR